MIEQWYSIESDIYGNQFKDSNTKLSYKYRYHELNKIMEFNKILKYIKLKMFCVLEEALVMRLNL